MSQNPARISEIIDRAKISPYQILILSLCFLIVLLDGFDTAVIGYIAPALREEWDLQPAQLSPAFGAGLFGLLLGSLIFGPVADAIGRKRVLLASILIFGGGTLACAYTDSIASLTLLRLITGIGLGGAMPTCITLSSEYSPARRRMLMVTLSWSGFTAGLALGGILAGQIIPAFGWRGVLMAGGIVPLLLLPLLAWQMPESARFMTSHPKYADSLRRVVGRITGKSWAGVTIVDDERSERARSPISHLFTEGRALRTLLLWLAFFCSLFVFYLLTSWLPSILKDAGYDIAHASRIGAMVPLGGTLGAILMALLMDRVGPYKVLALSYLGAALVVGATGYLMGDVYTLAAAVFLIGFGVAGAQNGLNLVSTTLYPTAARVTGVSWAMANGRFGSIVGAMLGAWMISAAGSAEVFFIWLALPVLVGSAAIFLLYRLSRSRQAPDPGENNGPRRHQGRLGRQ
ncbi:MFS transporter [Serratia ficaria]|uniref:4-hydroxybenzoate transporter PcaK n=1 Tax=Serratia ficaria TaxID=61651 RepID=A0A240CAK0_SERFI|nr:aromatic acid/H+ symport family MFS transporter [Serratia ficaria]REF43218.1 AAHS family 4-hydroxybenzoate transporter-like MFS transporter [Serratia ficaria]CAI0709291.1 4-hydroxybenzoate transporter PcaK [Serratia ficaria]CAI1054567.1 4-hydroxybenzoate transporter PcaK [Serratia ficaria]CAI1109824.1 4-hydroxybenzoate transporter PcaK [Serratia ficaria]CAI2067229.1 4-hydroxybenzoate transporter PcaK [Serratia ficaria]